MMTILRQSTFALFLFGGEYLSNVVAAPAVIWTQSTQQYSSTIHTSKAIAAGELLSDSSLLPGPSSLSNRRAAVSGVVFLLERYPDGSESFSLLASEGKLPLIQSEYAQATIVHHNVQNVDGTGNAWIEDATRSGHSALQVSMEEFDRKLLSLKLEEENSTGSVANGRRAVAVANADVFVIKIDASNVEPSEIDRAVVQAIRHSGVEVVVVASVRSVDEVKKERSQLMHRRMNLMELVTRTWTSSEGNHRRRLQEAEADDAGNMEDFSGVYYVNMTPNILAGILFTFLFAFITMIAVSCMGMISGQDVYVSKYPSIGREA